MKRSRALQPRFSIQYNAQLIDGYIRTCSADDRLSFNRGSTMRYIPVREILGDFVFYTSWTLFHIVIPHRCMFVPE